MCKKCKVDNTFKIVYNVKTVWIAFANINCAAILYEKEKEYGKDFRG